MGMKEVKTMIDIVEKSYNPYIIAFKNPSELI
jgi:hypothetical protein